MSRLTEGVNASFVGWSGSDLEVGDRCYILSDQGDNHVYVRWTSGQRTGQYEMMKSSSLVPDSVMDDEFGFEVESGRRVVVSCREVLDRGGTVALMQALEDAGHLDDISRRAMVSVTELRTAAMRDPAWRQVMDELGDDAMSVTREAIRLAVLTVLESDGDDEVD